ncbi:MAG: DUF2555 domain-containing protein [Leptolyngbya foveolarum]|uniref:DUF2555 domain-containing protein n=1 Tax=Leptolyngbya foveolarum TaxID=47253 RepID=A0A2W4UF18_9CYAN|nr:MAG: DUF2555 domain-containing protein [Leptolyngbya foveolarum]
MQPTQSPAAPSKDAPSKTPSETPSKKTGQLHISAEEIAQMTPDDVAKLAQRLEQDEYETAFEGLQDWHLLRAVAFQRSELVEPYLHLLDLEAFDES